MWYYSEQEVIMIPDNVIGFVYIITNKTNNRKYIGKKLASFTKTYIRMVTLKSGVKKKKKIKRHVESDWRDYYGSCVELLNDVTILGKDKFHREIIQYCYSKGELSYTEAKLQFKHDVLLNDEYYNGIINCKIHKKHIKKRGF